MMNGERSFLWYLVFVLDIRPEPHFRKGERSRWCGPFFEVFVYNILMMMILEGQREEIAHLGLDWYRSREDFLSVNGEIVRISNENVNESRRRFNERSCQSRRRKDLMKEGIKRGEGDDDYSLTRVTLVDPPLGISSPFLIDRTSAIHTPLSWASLSKWEKRPSDSASWMDIMITVSVDSAHILSKSDSDETPLIMIEKTKKSDDLSTRRRKSREWMTKLFTEEKGMRKRREGGSTYR